jgi:hypothetical protein
VFVQTRYGSQVRPSRQHHDSRARSVALPAGPTEVVGLPTAAITVLLRLLLCAWGWRSGPFSECDHELAAWRASVPWRETSVTGRADRPRCSSTGTGGV